MGIVRIGLDIAKTMSGKEALEFFPTLSACLIGIEAGPARITRQESWSGADMLCA